MTDLPALVGEDLEAYGPLMQALNPLQRAFVEVYLDHPDLPAGQLAERAGYTKPTTPGSNQLATRGHLLLHNERVIAAINEQASRRLRGAGGMAVKVLLDIARSPGKDQLKAAIALLDRTGFHALSEHKVTVDDKRPQNEREMRARITDLISELGGVEGLAKLGNVVDAEFTVIDPEVEGM